MTKLPDPPPSSQGTISIPRRAPRRRPTDPFELHESTHETQITGVIRAAISRLPYVWIARNNTGKLKDINGRMVTYGLGTGSADLIGLVTIDVDDGHVGLRQFARFLAIEVKSAKGQPTKEQLQWLGMIVMMGGAAGIARNVRDAAAIIATALDAPVDRVIGEIREAWRQRRS